MLAVLLALLSFGDLHYRWIGPAVMGGRIDAVAGVPGDPKTIYLGHASGGLWKSTDGGLTFSSILNVAHSSAAGAIAIDPRNPRRIFAATGEPFPRNTADAGDGLWRSMDGGGHWTHAGFANAASISRIAIDPANPAIVLVAAMGHEFAPSSERGLYRSTDGGNHFTRVLYVNGTTGSSDVAFDPKHPNVVYAGMFDFLRKPWSMRSGGPGSGLYRSIDAGAHWTLLTDPRLHNGLPQAPIDRVGVSICASNPDVVYAFVPNRMGLLYRSTDGGKRWQLRNSDQNVDFRPFYFSQVRCHPRNPDRVYAVAGSLMVSNDGGLHFHDAGGGGDNHDLWIDPKDPDRMLNASDIGFFYTLDGASTWSDDNVVPFAQVYRVGYDMDIPYHVMGGLQDNEAWWGPNTIFSKRDAAGDGAWHEITDWGDGQYALADPHDSATVYADDHFGDLARLNLRTGERRYISPQPLNGMGSAANGNPLRFNWTAPIVVSRFDGNTLYYGANVLFKSVDRGETWQQLGGDRTQCDPSQLGPSGGPVTHDNTNAEYYCTIYTIDEDAADPKTLWYGTDNGHLLVTRDEGASWNDVFAATGIAAPARVARISASPARTGVAYAAFDRHQWDDSAGYAAVTTDFGKTWRRIDAGLEGYVHVVREDPRNPRVLYAGTQRGVFVSFDAGAHWNDLRLGLPHLPIFDLQIQPRDNDLIVGTHARGFYIFDDLSPLQQFREDGGAQLFAPMPAFRYVGVTAHRFGRGEFVGDQKPYGALFTLYLPQVPAASPGKKPAITVTIRDSANASIDRFAVPVHAGFNRFVWDLHESVPGRAHTVQDARRNYIFIPLRISGPEVLPGTYTVQINVSARTLTVPVVVKMDPHSTSTLADLTALHDAMARIAVLQERAEALLSRAMREKNSALADMLRNPEPSGYRQPARVIEQLAYLHSTIEQSLVPPTTAQDALIERYAKELDALERP